MKEVLSKLIGDKFKFPNKRLFGTLIDVKLFIYEPESYP